MTSDGVPPTRDRPSIAERETRRALSQGGGRDRFESLLWALRGGQEVPLERRRHRLPDWRPVLGLVLRVAIVAAVGYACVSVAYNAWRDARTDTWTGPEGSVQSGQRLADCPIVNVLHDEVFPTWIRFGGAIYRLSSTITVVGPSNEADYPWTGYALGDMRVFRVANTPEGRAGQTIVLKLASSYVGEDFRLTPECR